MPLRQSPGDHDACDPKPRANPLQKDVGGYFKQKISNEEKSGPKAEGGLAKPERLVHMQLGKADIDPIEIGHEVAQDQERYQPPHDFADDTPFDVHGVPFRYFYFLKAGRIYSATVACLAARPLAPQHGPAANTSVFFRDPRGKMNICWQVFLQPEIPVSSGLHQRQK